MMLVYLIDAENKVLQPTRKIDMIRRWIKKGQAKIISVGFNEDEPLVVQVFKTFTRPTVKPNFPVDFDLEKFI